MAVLASSFLQKYPMRKFSTEFKLNDLINKYRLRHRNFFVEISQSCLVLFFILAIDNRIAAVFGHR
ncbi:CLUMA_CG009177, isoform A [Clunio marinus]|uniref:CLUMA_CG009177, isoform A n=1 Tax=Clunio marinus TaxID=568069 RepID=A0A1J1I629_9DIPT|nr:CLUMA_CG009177, isoform A [Clunio marinus]